MNNINSESQMFQEIRRHWKRIRANAHREHDILKSKNGSEFQLNMLKDIASEYHCLLNQFKVETHKV